MNRLYLILFLFLGCGKIELAKDQDARSQLEEGWTPSNDPQKMLPNYEKRFEKLPTAGSLKKLPWSDTLWKEIRGGIANRWNGGGDGLKYEPIPLENVKKLSKEEISRLSPAEKYAILVGDEQYDLVDYERWRSDPNRPGWDHLCNGWAATALNYLEPRAVTLKSEAGIDVPFGSSDIKALLNFNQASCYAPMVSVGERCDEDFASPSAKKTDPKCRDVNPGSFHIILSNYIGIQNLGFVADLDVDAAVNNRPVYAYESKIVSTQEHPSEGASPGTEHEVILETTIHVTGKSAPAWNATEHQEAEVRVYRYRLEINHAGEILGGEWLQLEHPDFLWMQKTAEFTGYFEKLKTLYDLSTQN